MRTNLRLAALPFILLLILSGVSSAVCQTELLTNSDVLNMVRAGLNQEVVLRKIRTTPGRFDVTSTALIELKNANVPDAVIDEMLERQADPEMASAPNTSVGFSDSGPMPGNVAGYTKPPPSKRDMVRSARTIALVKSSAHPSRQALEKELMKRPDFSKLGLTITRYKDSADLYVEIGYVSLSWITHRYVYRIYDRRTGSVIAAGETTSWGSLAENLARNIARSLNAMT